MTDTAVTVGESPLAHGSHPPVLPTLPSASTTPTLPALPIATPAVTQPAAPTMAVVPNAGAPLEAPGLPVLPLPVLPAVGPIGSAPVEIPEQLVAEIVAGEPERRNHPMAHLMPDKPKPNEASLRAAEQRAARKAKSRKIRIVVAIVALAAAAIAGPPLVKWLVNAVNEAGSTPTDETDQPVEQSFDDLLNDSPAAGIDAIDDAKQLTGNTTP